MKSTLPIPNEIVISLVNRNAIKDVIIAELIL